MSRASLFGLRDSSEAANWFTGFMMSISCPDCELRVEVPELDSEGLASCPACGADLSSEFGAVPMPSLEQVEPQASAEDGHAGSLHVPLETDRSERDSTTEHPCPHCGRPIAGGALECPYGCGNVEPFDACPTCQTRLSETVYGRLHAGCTERCRGALLQEIHPEAERVLRPYWRFV